jgi:hypothetical protein
VELEHKLWRRDNEVHAAESELREVRRELQAALGQAQRQRVDTETAVSASPLVTLPQPLPTVRPPSVYQPSDPPRLCESSEPPSVRIVRPS